MVATGDDHHSQWAELWTQWTPSLPQPEGEAPLLLPVAVLVHGGSWTCKWCSDLHDAMAADLCERGWAVFNTEFRRVGHEDQPSGHPGAGYPGTLLDVAAALNTLEALAGSEPELGLDLTRLVIGGHSSGGHLALWAAQAHRSPLVSVSLKPRGVVAFRPATDLLAEFARARADVENFMGATPVEDPEAYALANPMALLPLYVSVSVVRSPSAASATGCSAVRVSAATGCRHPAKRRLF